MSISLISYVKERACFDGAVLLTRALCYDVGMSKKPKNQKPLFKISLGSRRIVVTKPRLQWVVLATLVTFMAAAQFSGLYPYMYGYARCDGPPVEIRGSYYRVFVDENYGIHPGSDYAYCLDELPTNLERDPSTRVAKAEMKKLEDEANRLERLADEYEIYIPDGYEISEVRTSEQGDGLQTSFSVISSNPKFTVREMGKDSDFSYTNLCSRPAAGSWSGTIIGSDSKGRDVCRVNINKYIKDYIVGINIGKTAIMLRTSNSDEEDLLNSEAIKIFNAMQPYSN